jgi:hypothetical protein
MTTSWKCAQCGLVNFASATNCKRCGTAAASAGEYSPPPPAGIVLEDGYVLPPPPTIGSIWRDGSTMIMTKEASLPDQCVKCNAPANGLRLKRRLSWHHPVLYLLILVAWIFYVLLAVLLRKRATVYLGLCAEHFQRRRKLLAVGWILLAIGLISPVVAFANDYPAVGLLGLLVLIISIVWLILVTRVVTVKKIDDRLVWLGGIDSNYLAQFPLWQGQV